MLDSDHLMLLARCQRVLSQGFSSLPGIAPDLVPEAMSRVLDETARRLQDNYPYHHPFYLGQMLRPPHPVALLAYSLAMTINPNNHAHDGSRATSPMEREAVAQLAEMFDWQEHLGHLCSGGTIANFEALWVAREMAERPGIAASGQAHYTHERLSRVLQVPFFKVPCDEQGKMNLVELERMLKESPIGTVVVTLGTTGLGAVDPLAEIVKLRSRLPFRLHVDAAYGGYFKLASHLKPETARHFQSISEADSIVVDPHKHGLQPYGCGCVLFRDRSEAAIYQHQSPYTYFTSDDLHLGEISLECSRPGSAAAALWATQQLFPLIPEGEFARDLDRCRAAAVQLADWVRKQPRLQLVTDPELDIVVWQIRSQNSTRSSELARKFFDLAARQDLHLALLTLPRSLVERTAAVREWDSETITCVRTCLMKPEHQDWMLQIIGRLGNVLRELED